MSIAALPITLLVAIGAGAGLVAGLAGAWLADELPRRTGITHLVTGPKRRRRNVAVVAITTLAGAGAAHAAAGHGLVYLVTSLVLAAGLVSAAAVDVEHMILPNEVTLGGAVLALATSHFGVGVRSSLFGAALGFAVAWLPSVLYRRVRGRSGQGMGDTKLAILAGAWQGPFGAVFVLFAGAIQQILGAVVMAVLRISYPVPESVRAEIAELRELARGEGPEAAEAKALLDDDPMATSDEELGSGLLATRLPLGPFLVAACLELLVFRERIVQIAVTLFSPG